MSCIMVGDDTNIYCCHHPWASSYWGFLALQGIPDEYDEADINRLFSGRVLLKAFACWGQLLQ